MKHMTESSDVRFVRTGWLLTGLVALVALAPGSNGRAVVAPGGHSTAVRAPAENRHPGASADGDHAPVQHVLVPVSWQITRAKFGAHGATTQTESYRETWTWEVDADGVATLASLRAHVPVYRVGALRDEAVVPDALVMTEYDFARLVGVFAPAAGAVASVRDGRRFVTIDLSGNSRNGIDLTLSAADDEHFAVHFEIGAPRRAY